MVANHDTWHKYSRSHFHTEFLVCSAKVRHELFSFSLSLSFSTLNICDRPIITWNKAFCVCVFQRIYLIQPLFGAVVLQLFILRSSVEDEGWTHKCAPKCTHAHLCLQKNRRFHSLPQLPSFSYSCQNTIRQGIIYIIIPTYISHYASGALRADWHTTCQDFIHAINKRH